MNKLCDVGKVKSSIAIRVFIINIFILNLISDYLQIQSSYCLNDPFEWYEIFLPPTPHHLSWGAKLNDSYTYRTWQ